MDPELYVFPNIDSAPLKIAASTALFILVILLAALITPLLPGSELWATIDRTITVAGGTISLANLLHILLGHMLFIYGSFHAWQATRLKNTVEDPKHELATRILDTGYYARVRHPMYGMFILANVGLGFAMHSVYGLGFGLLSLAAFVANGIFEERYVMLRFFGEPIRTICTASGLATSLQHRRLFWAWFLRSTLPGSSSNNLIRKSIMNGRKR